MSKIFDALNKADNEASAAVQRALSDQPAVVSLDAVRPTAESIPLDAPPPAVQEVMAGHMPPGTVDDAAGEDVFPLKLGPNSPLLPFDGSPNRASEEYRIIRTKILHHPKRPRMIVVSSADPGDGKSVTAINLAGALSLKSDATVLLLDTDFRRSSIALTLGLPTSPGLADVLTGKCRLSSIILRAEQMPNLYIVPAGECKSNPAEFLDSSAWRETCAALRVRFGHIVMDSPPIHAVADYRLIEAVADGVIAVVRPDCTKRSGLMTALQSISSEKLLGIVMNGVSDWFLAKRQSYEYSYQHAEHRHG